MSQAENLLDSLTVDDITPYTAEPQTEGHIVIGRDRFITVPESLKRIAVQGDKNIETVTFDCPRYWDEHDLYDMQIFVNFMRPDGHKGSYIAQNKTVDTTDTSIIHFTWTIDEDVTPYKGNLKFLVCAKVADAETGLEELHWNSEINDEMFISEGLECEESIVEQNYAVITQLLTRMDEVEAMAVTEAEMAAHVANANDAVTRAEAAVATAVDKAEDMSAIFEKFHRELPVNRLNPDEISAGRIEPSGVLVTEDEYGMVQSCHSGLISVNPGEVITLQCDVIGEGIEIALMDSVAAFDINGNVIPSAGVLDEQSIHSYTVPAGVAYIRVSSYYLEEFYAPQAVVSSGTVIPYEEYSDRPTYGELKPEVAISTTSQLGNAIKGHASGEIIKIDDISPAMHNVNCWVHSKNLFNGSLIPGIIRSSGMEIDAGDSEVYRSMIMHLPKAGTYTVSFSTPINIVRLVKDNIYVVTSNLMAISSYTFSIASGCDVGITFRDTTSSDTVWDDSNTVQVEIGSTATEYEPYVDPTTVTVSSFGKNLLDISNGKTSDTVNGVTITRIGDQIKLNGTLTTDSNLFNNTFHMFGGIGNKYTLSYTYDGGTVSGNASICIGSKDTADSSSSRQSWLNKMVGVESGSFTNTLTRPYIKDFWFYVKAGTVFADYRIRVQLERGDTVTEHEVAKKVTYTPHGDGIADVISVSPLMNILTDTPGATMDCEYNRDTEKVVEETEIGVHAIAIRGTLVGASVRTNDVNTLTHDLDVRVTSKNLMNTSCKYGTIVAANGTMSTSTTSSVVSDYIYLSEGNYFISYKNTVDLRGIAFYKEKNEASFIKYTWAGRPSTFSYKFTVDEPCFVRMDVETDGYVSIDNITTFFTACEFQLERGTVKTAYEPFFDVAGMRVYLFGKNLSQIYSAELKGVAITENIPVVYEGRLPDGAVLSWKIDFTQQNTNAAFRLVDTVTGEELSIYPSKKLEVIPPQKNKVRIDIPNTGNHKGKISEIQLELGSSQTAFSQYIAPSSAVVTANNIGIVSGLKSISPNMTLVTDNAGAVIECGYYRDATKVIQKLEERLAALEAK